MDRAKEILVLLPEMKSLMLRLQHLILLVIALVSIHSGRGQQISHSAAAAKAHHLVEQMTLDEKIEQMHGIHDATRYRLVHGNARLGIPDFSVTNGPAGVGPGGAGSQKPATALPAPIALAATWDPEAARLYGRVAAEETRTLGFTLLESPDINIARVPQGGRVFEAYGEDPFLTSRLAVANIEGIQSTGVIANVKHYLANNQETDRGTINELVGDRALREIYMPAFEAAIKEGHVASLMCAYPRVNGGFNCENQPLLTGVLRGDWKFDGFVTSDFGAVHSTAASLQGGLNLELPTGIYFGDALKQAVEQGLVPTSLIDRSIELRLTKMLEMGWFRKGVKEKPIDAFRNGLVSKRIAEEGMVLLKNQGSLLPLDREKLKTVALIGPYAVRQMTGGGGSSHVIPLYSVAPVDGLDGHLLSQTKILLLDGNDIEAAVDAARKADVAILMLGDDEGEDHDHGISLPAGQDDLIEAVSKANAKAVVVIKSGSAVLMPWIDRVPAVLEAWYPGEEDGNAVAEVLLGLANPSGKLPLSFPKAEADTLARNRAQFPGNGTTVHYSEGLNVGYRGYNAAKTEVLFPFGYGLSYTTFIYSDLKVTQRSAGAGASVSVRVTNTGARLGAEVVQVYLTYPPISEGDEPPKQLKGFKRVVLNPGESKIVTMQLGERSFCYWSESAHGWKEAHGDFRVEVGGSSANTPLSTALSISSKE